MRDYLLKISVIRRIVSGARSRMVRPTNLKLCRKGGAEGDGIGVLNGVHGTVRERTGKEIKMRQFVTIRGVIGVLGIASLVLVGSLAMADITPPPPPPPFSGKCDFLTGGGFIYPSGTDKGNFGVGGGCKKGSGTDSIPYWGHLEYHDHGIDLNVHVIDITAYFPEGDTGTDPKTHQPTGTRWVCGTARSNLYGDVDFAVRASDAGEPGTADEFDIQLTQNGVIVYSTFDFSGGTHHQLGGGTGGGGNIQLHDPNPSTTGEFGGSCPAA